MTEDQEKQEEEIQVSQEELEEVEQEVKKKEEEEQKKQRKLQEDLLEKGIKQGKEEAMREYERMKKEEQDRKEKEKLQSKIGELERELKEVPDKLSKEFEEKINKMRSTRRGVSRNDSPFNKPEGMNDEQTNTPDMSPEDIKQIEKESMERFYQEVLGRPAPSNDWLMSYGNK